MPAPLVASWRRHASAAPSSSAPRTLLLLVPVLVLLLFVLSRAPDLTFSHITTASPNFPAHLRPFDCYASPQASPVFASLVEGVPQPFLYSLADMGSLPNRPHKNIARLLKGKRFRKPDISQTIQELLAGKLGRVTGGVVVDVGANVGIAAFATAVMGFRVVAFEPVFENLQRICDGMYLNRVQDQVVVYHAAASDRVGNITMHKRRPISTLLSCCSAVDHQEFHCNGGDPATMLQIEVLDGSDDLAVHGIEAQVEHPEEGEVADGRGRWYWRSYRNKVTVLRFAGVFRGSTDDWEAMRHLHVSYLKTGWGWVHGVQEVELLAHKAHHVDLLFWI